MKKRYIIFFFINFIIISQVYSINNPNYIVGKDISSLNITTLRGECRGESYDQGFRVSYDCPIIHHACIYGEIEFIRNKFNGLIQIANSCVDSSVVFSECIFDGVFELVRDTLKGNTYIYNSVFNNTFILNQNVFESLLDFNEVTFNSSFRIYVSSFNEKVYFHKVVFKEDVLFELVKFNELNFNNITFNGNVTFFQTTLPDTFTFKNVKIKGDEIDFTKINLKDKNKKCQIDLTGTDINKIRLRLDKFEIYFPDTSYEQRVGIYEELLKNFKNNGFIDSYKKLDIEYKQFRYENAGLFSNWVKDPIQRLWWFYGYEPERVFGWALFFWFIFTMPLTYKLNLDTFQRHIYTIDRLNIISNDKFINKLIDATVYTAIIFFGLKITLKSFTTGANKSHPFLFSYIVFIYIVGLGCVGYIANFIFKS